MSANPGAPVYVGTEQRVAGPPPRRGWTAGRIVSLVAGSVLAFAALGALAGGVTLLWVTFAGRSGDFLTSGTATYVTTGRAITTQTIRLPADSWDGFAQSLVGKVRIRVTAADPARPVFLGIAPASAVRSYLSGASYTTITSLSNAGAVDHAGPAVPAAPGTSGIWVAHVSGTGTQSLVWTPPAGNWRVVVMNPDSAAVVSVRADIGATLPELPWIAAGLLAVGLICAAGAVLLIVIPIRRASR